MDFNWERLFFLNFKEFGVNIVNCLYQSLLWEANVSPNQEISRILWSPKLHERVQNGPSRFLLPRFIQSTLSNPVLWRSVLILFSHSLPGLPSRLFPSGFRIKLIYAFLFLHIHSTWPAQLIHLDWSSESYLMRSTSHESPHYVIVSGLLLTTPPFLCPNTVLST